MYKVLADALQYPTPGTIELLRAGLEQMPAGAVKKAFSEFVERVQALSLTEWEELHTRTLDLGPIVAPYVGWQIWGENYKRGEFMAQLNQALMESDIHPEGELPDHLIPIFRYLDANPEPLPELVEVLEPAVRAMRKALHKAEPDNPYSHLFDAIWQASQNLGVST
ncbi:MAG: nitrate reductase [Acidobacteria bacterium]|nr:nitrate reductase [Acidobacteriota bacterium]